MVKTFPWSSLEVIPELGTSDKTKNIFVLLSSVLQSVPRVSLLKRSIAVDRIELQLRWCVAGTARVVVFGA